MSDPTAFEDLLQAAALPEKTVELCLRPDLVAEVEDLERELRDLRTSTVTMSDRGKLRRVAEQIEARRADMQQASVVFRLRGLNRRDWAALIAAHPGRKDSDVDRKLGYNTESFFPAIIRASIIEPLLSDEQWERLDAVLPSSQFDALLDAALAVSRRKVDVPFSLAASATLQSSGETSSPQSA